jgi:hypothetical protein
VADLKVGHYTGKRNPRGRQGCQRYAWVADVRFGGTRDDGFVLKFTWRTASEGGPYKPERNPELAL